MYEKRTIAADSLQKYQLKILELESNNEVAAELGPLQYLSGLTGVSMDKIINILLLIIIFVFDPLAISLVVAANFAFAQAYPPKRYRENLYEEQVEVKEEPSVFDTYSESLPDESRGFPPNYDEEDEKRMDIIGQNGNDGEHYDEDNEMIKGDIVRNNYLDDNTEKTY